MKIHIIFLPALLLTYFHLAAQKKNSINYIHQKPPGKAAEVFAPGIISTGAIEHSPPAFSPDGKTVLWAIMKMPSYQTRLLEMNFSNNKWSLAQTPSFSDTSANEVYPDFSANGDTLFFCSDRRIDPSSPRKNTLWYVTRNAAGWSPAKLLDTNVYKKDIYSHSIATNGTRYFTIGPFRTSDWNIYNTGEPGKISKLPAPVNTEGYEDGPFVAPDESYLIFESNRPTGIKGNIDLYISFRRKDKTWAEPLNMGPGVNSASAERFAKVSPDSKYFFFGRDTGNGFDIYWMRSRVIEVLRKEAVKKGLLK